MASFDSFEEMENRTRQTFIRYLAFAKASTGERRAQLSIASDRGYISQETFDQPKTSLMTCARQIQALIRYLDSHPNTRRVKENGVSNDL